MKLALLYSKSKYDEHLVDGFRKNIDFVDGYIGYDDTANPNIWYNEGKIRNFLLKEAYEQGYDWALGLDPDERLAPGSGKRIREIIERDNDRRTVYQFDFRECYALDKYRVDGHWGRKWRRPLFPLKGDNIYQNIELHSHWFPKNGYYHTQRTDLAIYHLKHIQKGMAEWRRDIYNKVDTIKKQDYEYLADETDAQFSPLSRDVTNMLTKEFPHGIIYPGFSLPD